MAFDFSDVKRVTTGTIITRLAHSCAPWYKAYEKRCCRCRRTLALCVLLLFPREAY